VGSGRRLDAVLFTDDERAAVAVLRAVPQPQSREHLEFSSPANPPRAFNFSKSASFSAAVPCMSRSSASATLFLTVGSFRFRNIATSSPRSLRIVNRIIRKNSAGPPLSLTTASAPEGSVVPTSGPSSCRPDAAAAKQSTIVRPFSISAESVPRALPSFCR